MKFKKRNLKLGDKRLVKKFAWFPITTKEDDYYKWLCFVRVGQEVKRSPIVRYGIVVHILVWVNIFFEYESKSNKRDEKKGRGIK